MTANGQKKRNAQEPVACHLGNGGKAWRPRPLHRTSSTMKVIHIKAMAPRQVAREETILNESALAPNELLIRSQWSLTNTGTELARFTGLDMQISNLKYPFVMGWANVGTVLAAGTAVVNAAPGTRLLTFGPHASVFKISQDRVMASVPENVDSLDAIFARMGAVAITALRKAEFSAGDQVLVIGQGIVGHLAAQFFKIAGADVMVSDVMEARLDASRAAGLARTINPTTTVLKEAIAAWTGGKGPRIVVEAVGRAELICEAIQFVAQHGQVILLGTPRQKATLEVTAAFTRIHNADVTLKGAYLFDLPWSETGSAPYSIVGNVRQILEWIQDGRLNSRALRTRVFRPEQCQEAYDTLERQSDQYQAVLFDWREAR